MDLGAGLGRWGQISDANNGSSTFTPRSALLEAHLRAHGNTGEYGWP